METTNARAGLSDCHFKRQTNLRANQVEIDEFEGSSAFSDSLNQFIRIFVVRAGIFSFVEFQPGLRRRFAGLKPFV
jgi:hypothetical protein